MVANAFEFCDDGTVLFDRDVTIDDCLLVLRQKLAMFLKRIESYPRTSAGDYSRVSPRLGSLDGAGVLWEEVLAIAGVLQALTYREGDHILTRRDGSRPTQALCAMETRRTLKPLAELARELTFSILYEGGQFPSVIDRATAEKLECIAREIDALLHTGTSTPRPHHDASTSDQSNFPRANPLPTDAEEERDEFYVPLRGPNAADIKAATQLSSDTFRVLRKAAGFSTKARGARAARRRYSADEIDHLISTLPSTTIRYQDFIRRQLESLKPKPIQKQR